MKGLILLADGFEDSEGLTTRDVLLRGGIDVVTASITDKLEVISSHKLKLFADSLLSKLNLDEFDFLILPGGLKGVNNLSDSNEVINSIHYFIKNNKDVYAICAAPSILGKLGYLNNLKFTCYPGFEKGINGTYTGEGVTVSSNHIITSKSMAYSLDFGLAILKKNLGQEVYKRVNKSTKGL